MKPERKFLGWERACLVSAAEALFDRFGTKANFDLSNCVIVLPGSRAGRRLLEHLTLISHRNDLALIPPAILTLGALPEYLAKKNAVYASELESRLAWVEALRSLAAEKLKVLFPKASQDAPLSYWYRISKQIADLYSELSAERLSFLDVSKAFESAELFSDEARWNVLAELFPLYLAALKRSNLHCRHEWRERAFENSLYQGDAEVYLIGCADLNKLTRDLLDLLEVKVTALIYAEANAKDLFDEWGTVKAEVWQKAELELTSKQITVTLAPIDQAFEVLRSLNSVECELSQVTLGVGDREVVPYIKEVLGSQKILARDPLALPFSSSPIYLLLNTLRDLLQRRDFNSIGNFIRHPNVEKLLSKQFPDKDIVGLCDKYYSEHLPWSLDFIPKSSSAAIILELLEFSKSLIGELYSEPKKIALWGEPLLKFVATVFAQREYDRNLEKDRLTIEFCEKLVSIIETFGRCAFTQPLSSSDYITLILDALSEQYQTPDPQAGAVELIGWLELPLDDGEVLIVSGCNEHRVPESVNSDPFLPNALRSRLKLLDNDRRYARDAYALNAMIQCRKLVRVIAGSQTADGDPILPSRLLFACNVTERAKRVIAFMQGERGVSRPEISAGNPKDFISVPYKPEALDAPIESLSVTAIRDYQRCPYLFYLKHVLKLKRVNDEALELDALSFGNLAHAVLSRFAGNEIHHSVKADEIADWLSKELDRYVKEQFGVAPQPTLFVQVEQLRQRLRRFSLWQAQRRKDGWEIISNEEEYKGKDCELLVDSKALGLIGRIDRIDRRADELAVFDYKTSDQDYSVKKAYSEKGGWKDLQLPLYHFLVSKRYKAKSYQLGYIRLGAKAEEIGGNSEEFGSAELESAIEAARQVVRDIWAQKFWPPKEPIGVAEFAPLYGAKAVRVHHAGDL